MISRATTVWLMAIDMGGVAQSVYKQQTSAGSTVRLVIGNPDYR